MSHLKNYRGATNYFIPASSAYRSGYDRIFGKKETESTRETIDGEREEKESKDDEPKG